MLTSKRSSGGGLPFENISKKEKLYSRLDFEDYQIRIITIRSGGDGSRVDCSMVKKSLLNSEPYIALSHCWGNPEITKTISVNEVDFVVTENLWHALHRLRRMGKTRVWADAICINQNDRHERSLQVRIMRQIFSKASEVIAFVGPASKINEQAIPILNQPEYLFRDPQHPGSLTSRLRLDISHDNPDLDYIEDLNARTEESKSGERKVLDSFFALPYWKRVWIIQEVTVAATVTITCGDKCITWDKLGKADAYYQVSGTKDWSYVKRLILFRDAYRGGTRPGLLHAMQQTFESQSTDPRDKIFALLGICHDGDQLVPLPNYRQSTEEICRDFTRAVISAKKCLDFLFLPRTSVRDNPKYLIEGLVTRDKPAKSSWTVDWTHLPNSCIPVINSSKPVPGFSLIGSTHLNILTVRGSIIDTLKSKIATSSDTSLFKMVSIYYRSTIAFEDAVWTSLGLGVNHSSKKETRAEFFRSIWTDDGMCLLKPPMHSRVLEACRKKGFFNGEHYFSLKDWRKGGIEYSRNMDRAGRRVFERNFIEWLEDLGTTKVLGQALWEFQKMARHLEDSESDADGLIGKLFRFQRDAMNLILTNGGIIGVGPADAAVGDKLCYIAGCSQPVLLRPVMRNDHATYQLVGGARMIFNEDDARQQWAGLECKHLFEIS